MGYLLAINYNNNFVIVAFIPTLFHLIQYPAIVYEISQIFSDNALKIVHYQGICFMRVWDIVIN